MDDIDLTTISNADLADLFAGGTAMVAAYQGVADSVTQQVAIISMDLRAISAEIAKRVAAHGN